jgi:hypothetical protein
MQQNTVKIKFRGVSVNRFLPKNSKLDQELLTKNIKKRFTYSTSLYKLESLAV